MSEEPHADDVAPPAKKRRLLEEDRGESIFLDGENDEEESDGEEEVREPEGEDEEHKDDEDDDKDEFASLNALPGAERKVYRPDGLSNGLQGVRFKLSILPDSEGLWGDEIEYILQEGFAGMNVLEVTSSTRSKAPSRKAVHSPVGSSTMGRLKRALRST